MYRMDAIAFSKHIQCTREAKQDCLFTVRQLVELAYAAREEGLLKMDSLAEDTVRFPDPLLRQAAHLVAEVSGADRVRKVLYNYILAGGIQSPQKLLNGIIIAEGMVAIGEGEDLDYIFTYLIPSYFGIDYHETVHEIYLRNGLQIGLPRTNHNQDTGSKSGKEGFYAGLSECYGTVGRADVQQCCFHTGLLCLSALQS